MKASLKRYAVSATAYASKFRGDPYLRTEAMIVGLQAAFAVVMIALVAVAFNLLYNEALSNLVLGITKSIRMGAPVPSANTIVGNLDYLQSRDLVVVGAIILVATSVFSYLTTRLALRPTKSALAAQKIFIGNIAHELRTPLSIIRTNTEVRMLDPDVPRAGREVHESNLEELDRISNIINNLLSLSTLTSPEQVSFTNIDLNAVIATVVSRLEDLAHKKRIVVEVEQGDYALAWGNASAIEEILTNVLKNALNYTSEGGGSVRISMKPGARGYIEISVEDHGIGISEADLRHIFEPFYRADQARTRRAGGGGLGLAIVNELLKTHQGRMTIRSALGAGTCVVISLPPGKSKSGKAKQYEEVTMDFSA